METSTSATVFQFPIIVSFAATTHKFQGQEIPKTQKAAMDLRTIFTKAMGYVMLSRVTSKAQLYIVEKLPINKLNASEQALKELERMESSSVNKNPMAWEQHLKNATKLAILNIQSLRKKIKDIREDKLLLKFADMVCLTETWLPQSNNENDFIDIENYSVITNNYGQGKGVTTYYKSQNFQLTKLKN